MADVNQRLGFDASQAVKSLEQLSFTVDTVNQSIQKMNTTAKGDPTKKVREGALATEKTLQRLTRNVEHLRRELIRTGRDGQQAANQVSVSWNTVLRVLQTQVLLRGLNELQRQFVETAEAAREFELQIARITTIAGDEIAAGTEQLSLSVRNLAIELGRPIEEVSSAAFQTLQNDVGDVGESLEFLRNASKLATVQGSELETAMNALTSVFKVYGEDAGNAADAADTFFVAVDKGRITIDELANRLGTVIGPAEQIGLTFDQVAAAAASLTQTGLDTATATTQLRNIVLKLVKPTEDLERAFRTLGVTTANELIAQNNGELLPTLQDLQRALGGTEEAVAKAFGTFRGQLGVFNLLTQEGQLFQNILDAFPNKAGKLTEAFGKVEQTNAREFDKELAKLNDTLLTLGDTAASFQTTGLRFLNLIVQDAGDASAAIAALGAVAVATFARSAAGAGALRLALTALNPAAIATVAAIGGLTLLATKAFPDATASIQETSRALSAAIAAIEDGADARVSGVLAETDAIQAALKDQQSSYADFFQELDSLYADDQTNFERRADLLEETGRRLVENFVDSRTELLERVDDALAQIDDRIISSTENYQDAVERLDEFRFDQTLKGLDDVGKAVFALSRAQQTAREAQEAYNRAALDPAALSRAQELQRLAERQAEQALRLADRSENQSQISQARVATEQIYQQALEGEARQIQFLNSLNNERLGADRDRLALLLEQEKAIAQQIQSLTSRTDAEGGIRSNEEIIAAQREINDLEAKRLSIRDEIKSIPILEAFDLSGVEEKTNEAFQRGINQVQFDFTNAITELESAITDKTYGINLQIVDPEILTRQVQEIFDNTAGLNLGERLEARQQALQQLVDQQAGAQESLAKTTARFNELANAVNGFNNSVSEGRSLFGNFEIGTAELFGSGLFSGLDTQELLSRDIGNRVAQDIVAAFNQLRDEGAPAIDEVAEKTAQLQSRIQQLGAEQKLTASQTQALTNALAQVEAASQQIQERSQALNLIDADAAREALVILQNQGQTYDALKRQIEEAKTSQDNLNLSVQRSNNTLPQTLNLWNQISRAVQAAAVAAQQVTPPQGAAVASQFFGGKVVRRNAGGDLTRGQDQTLVAAQDGEFITSARNSQRFFAELRAINSGKTPVFREQGGPVTNIGDVHVNVDARNAQTVDGRQVARQLKRELRRGSSTL